MLIASKNPFLPQLTQHNAILGFQYAAKEFGTCPLVQCAGQPVLPVGIKDEVGAHTVKIFCPKCQCVYHPPPVRSRSNQSNIGSGGGSGVDGASFGTTFPHLFLMTFSNLVPDPLPPDSSYIPRVFGFRVHQSARQGSALAHTTASPTQMIVINRTSEFGADAKDDTLGRSRSVEIVGSVFTTSKPYDADDATRSSKGSSSRRQNSHVPDEAVNEEEDRKRKNADRNGDKSENGGTDSLSSKRRKRSEKDL
jgi:hypothetical protein